ncbi:MAG: ABC transporter ATP-binding protein [Solirubrobacterales bacterium]
MGGTETTSGAQSVTFDEVVKQYPGQGEPAVRSLSFEVPAGEICVLVGPSGCGKTTALRMVNRMVEPSGGEILIGDEPTRSRNPDQLRREIGYVIQQIGLFPHRTVAQNIGTVPKLLGWDSGRTEERSRELIEVMGLDPEMADRYPGQLSGGQRQRVGVARALATDPPVMLMDEPFGAIDPVTRERLQNEFLRLQADLGKTILFVTHDIDEAIKMGDRIAVLDVGGRLAQFATPAELLMAPADEFVESFVGSDRALKRLSLMRVGELDLWEAPLAYSGQPMAEARRKLAEASLPHLLVVDAERRPLGWVSEADLDTEYVTDSPSTSPEPRIEVDDVLRDALSDLLGSETQFAPVVDREGKLAGVLSAEIISEFLNSSEATSLRESAGDRAALSERESGGAPSSSAG